MWVTPALEGLENGTWMRKEVGLASDGVRERKQQGLHHGFKDISLPSHSANHFFVILTSLFYKKKLVSSVAWQWHLIDLSIQ